MLGLSVALLSYSSPVERSPEAWVDQPPGSPPYTRSVHRGKGSQVRRTDSYPAELHPIQKCTAYQEVIPYCQRVSAWVGRNLPEGGSEILHRGRRRFTCSGGSDMYTIGGLFTSSAETLLRRLSRISEGS